jgi:hypothetical protein
MRLRPVTKGYRHHIILLCMALKDIGTDTWWNDTPVIKPVTKG